MAEGQGRKDRPQRVTMAAIGRIAGVSQVTVSRALSNPSKVSPETLQRIHAAIDQTGFVPNAIAGALASRRSMLISALVPSITNLTYSSMIHAFSEGLREAGYQILLSETGFSPEDEERAIKLHLSRRPDAMMLTGVSHSAGARRALIGADIPVVELWDISESPVDFCIGFSHEAAGRAVADFAAARGADEAAVIYARDARAKRRKAAFAERFTALTGGGVADPGLDLEASLLAGRQAMAALMDEQGFDGGLVFCSSDMMAHGAMTEVQARGRQVPEDFAVVGFGDQEFATGTVPPLTTVRVDRERLGRQAASELIARIEGRGSGDVSVDLGFEMIRRGSA
ncbi:LacI family DNA-binding transcriptional regulator [Marinibacterium sp. SX1]|uniref:LacI family DNA-binding transcriptional regulator n=1 Tax=Marinibacterium sp. SX1 TaxID=3388424 RepID=UPI003D16CBC4